MGWKRVNDGHFFDEKKFFCEKGGNGDPAHEGLLCRFQIHSNFTMQGKALWQNQAE